MQRMIVGLVLFLTVAVGALAIAVVGLHDASGTKPRGRGAAPTAERSIDERVLEGRLEAVERHMEELLEEVVWLRREQEALRRLSSRPTGEATDPVSNVGEPTPSGNAEFGDEGALFPGEPARGPDGEFQITAEDEAYFMAIQQRVERRRRIDGLTRGLMRRLDRMTSQGSLSPLTDTVREAVERVFRTFVTKSDDLTVRYVRQPTERAQQMTPEEKREAMSVEREAMVLEAQRALEELVGVQQAAAIAEQALENPWGRRVGSGIRPGLGNR